MHTKIILYIKYIDILDIKSLTFQMAMDDKIMSFLCAHYNTSQCIDHAFPE